MLCRIEWLPVARRQLRKCPKAVHDARFRVRSGDYRAIYEVRDTVLVVLVVAVGHRRDVYR